METQIIRKGRVHIMDREPNAYERLLMEREAERAARRENGKTAARDDVDRCRAVYSLNGKSEDDGEPEFY